MAARPRILDVPARSLRDRVRDQSLDEPAAAGRSADWPRGSGGRCTICCMRLGAEMLAARSRAGAAGPGVHGERGPDLPAAGDPGPLSPSAAAGRRAAVRRLAAAARLRGRAAAGGAVFRRGGRRAVLRRDADRRLPHPQRRAEPADHRRAARLPGDSAGADRRALLSPRHLLLPARAGRGDLVSRRVRRLRPPRADRADSHADRGRAGGGPARSPATPWSSARTSSPTPAARSCTGTSPSRGYTPHETPLSEFIKAGGSAKCLTLRLDGEEAAAWKAG